MIVEVHPQPELNQISWENDDEDHKEQEPQKDGEHTERWSRGAVALRNYVILTRLGGGLVGVIGTILLFGVTITNHAACDVWLAKWLVMISCKITYKFSDTYIYDDGDEIIVALRNYLLLISEYVLFSIEP